MLFRYLVVLVLVPALLATNLFGTTQDNGLSVRMRHYFSRLLPPASVEALNAGLEGYKLPTLPPHEQGSPGGRQVEPPNLVALLPRLVALFRPASIQPIPGDDSPLPPTAATPQEATRTSRLRTSTPSRTTTRTRTGTASPTAGELTFIPLINLVCRDGPSVDYVGLGIALKDQPYRMDGRNEENSWYRLMLTSSIGCWVAASGGTPSGDTLVLRILNVATITPGTTPTSTPEATPTIDLTIQ